MPISSLLLIPLFFLLPGMAFVTGGGRTRSSPASNGAAGHAGTADMVFLSVALSGWVAQTLALAGWFNTPALAISVTLLSLALILRRGPENGLRGLRQLRLTSLRPTFAAVFALLTLILLAVLLYRPPGVNLLGGPPAPSFYGLGLHLAATGSLPALQPSVLLAGAAEAMRAAAGQGLFYPAWTGLLQLLGGAPWSAAAPVLFVALALAAAFRLGRLAGGSSIFGALLLLVLGINYPQAWLARVSVPESAAQFLVLASALFYLRSRDGFPGIPAASLTLGTAALCTPGLLECTPLALLLLLALHAGASMAERRRAALYSLGVLPFLAQGWFQSGLFPTLPACLATGALLFTLLLFLRPPASALKSVTLPLLCWSLLGSVWAVWLIFAITGSPMIPGGSAHWMIWYVTLPFMVMMAGGLLELLSSPRASLRLISGMGPLFPLALVSASLILHHPGSGGIQPWAARPFTVTVIPVTLLVGLLFFHRMLGRLRHPALRVIWCSLLAVLLGLNLANLMPMATGKPGTGAAQLVQQTTAALTGERPFTVVVEPGPGALGLHTALAGVSGIGAMALHGTAQDRHQFHRLVREEAAAGRRTALVVAEGLFTPDPAQVLLWPLAVVEGDLRHLPPETDHLPSSVVARRVRLQIFEIVPLPEMSLPTQARSADQQSLKVRVGAYGEDWPFLESGFQGVTTAGGRTFRWTGKLARIRIPAWSRSLELTVGGYRPPGAPDAAITAGFTGQPPLVTRVLPRQGFVTVGISWAAVDQPQPLLDLRSTSFSPDPWFTDWDGRPRGVQLAEIAFQPAGQSIPIKALGN